MIEKRNERIKTVVAVHQYWNKVLTVEIFVLY